MRIVEVDAGQRELDQVFLPQEPRRVMPSDLAEEIVLQHPAQPPSSSFRNFTELQLITGANAATSIFSGAPGSTGYLWVHAFDADHNDPAGLEITLWLENISTGVRVSLVRGNVPLNETLACPRSVLMLNSDWRLNVSTLAIAAGARLRLRALWVGYRFAENHPNI